MNKLYLATLLIFTSNCGFNVTSSKLSPSGMRYTAKIARNTHLCNGVRLPQRDIITGFSISAEQAESYARQACADEAKRSCGEYANRFVRMCNSSTYTFVEIIVTNNDNPSSPKTEFTCETEVISGATRFTTITHGRSKVSCDDACGQNERYANRASFKNSWRENHFPWRLTNTCTSFEGRVTYPRSSSIRN